MTFVRLAFALLSLLAAIDVRAAAPAPIAFLGLRPTDSASLSGTAIAQLPEAQRLRGVAENVVELLSGGAVLRHDALRAALGATYLVELFDCKGEPACQLRVASPLRRRGLASAIVGDYHAGPDGFRVRIRRLDLRSARLSDETTFLLARADAESLEPWRAALQPMFQDTGSLRVVTNVAGAACTLDARPCDAGADGAIASVPEGEHLLELSKDGYRRAHRVVVVARGKELRVALPLEELPMQAQAAPAPTPRVPTFEEPGDTTRVVPFGYLRLALAWDTIDAGYREDPVALPSQGGVGGGDVVALPRPALLGVTVQAPRSASGWQLRGAVSAAWVKEAGPEIDAAYAEILKEDAGTRIMLGQGPGIVSSLVAGTLTFPEGFGDLAAGFVGVTASQSIGWLLLEGFVGRHKSQFSTSAEPAASSPGPFGAARVAIVSEKTTGKLYGKSYPLTLGLSAAYGGERVGLAAEQAWAAAAGIASPVREDVAVRVASVEVYLPFGKRGSLAGEAWAGDDVHLLEGALWQLPRVDPATGRHTPLRSAGGWAQLAVEAGSAVEVRLVAGVDRVLRGLGGGLAPDGAPAIRQNGLAAANVVWYPLDHLALGLQVHAIRTDYLDAAAGTCTLIGVAATSQLDF